MTGLSEHRSISAALLRIVTGAVIVLVLLACDNGQPDTLADNGEVMLTLRISLPTATDGSTATRAITSNEENAIDIAQLKVLVFKASGSTETFSYEAPQVQLLGGKYMVTLKQSLAGEKYRLAVIANTGKKLPVIPDNTPKSDVLKMITFDAAGIWNATGTTSYSRFPMWGGTSYHACHIFGKHHVTARAGTHRRRVRAKRRNGSGIKRVYIENGQRVPHEE